MFGNIADYGGGIYCSSNSAGSASSINVANHSGIIANFANSPLVVAPNGRGAGVYIDKCYFAIFIGSNSNASFWGMDVNTATNHGGAIYAEDAIIRLHGHQSCGSLGCLGDDTNPVSFRSNESNFGDGAVIYAENSDVKINATWMEGNAGESTIFTNNSDLVVERFLQPCWSNADCNLIENNNGTAMAGFSNDKIDVSSVNIVDNDTTVFDYNVGSPAIPALIRVESCLINNNGDNNNDYLFNFNGFFDA